MNKEPIGLYIFRFIMGAGLFCFMLMLYWSSLLIEEDLQSIRSDLEQLKKDIFSQKALISNDISSEAPRKLSSTGLASLDKRPNIDAALPNLLEEDPFYATTLPKMLGPNFKPQGTFHIASPSLGKPQNLHPFSNWAEVAGWISQCTAGVAKLKVGIFETLSPDMALKMEERKNKETGKLEFWIHLRDGVYWAPLEPAWFTDNVQIAPHFLKRHQVTAHDFKFYYDAFMNSYVQETGAVALRTLYDDIEDVQVIDDLTFVVRWKGLEVKDPDGKVSYKTKYVARSLTGGLRPLASFVYKYFADGSKILEDDNEVNAYRKNSVWAQNFAQHWAKNIIVSCGAWLFDGMTDRQIKFKRNREHYQPLEALALASEVQFKDTPEAKWQEFKVNHLDTYEIRPDQILEYKTFQQSPQYKEQAQMGAAIKRIDFVGRIYFYIGWNEAKPLFKNKKVRQALTMAIDRKRIIENYLNGLGIETNGTFYRYSSAYDTSIEPWPYDIQRSRRLLEEEGWVDRNGDGTIDKVIDGKDTPFRFRLTYFVKNPNSKAISEYVATALKDVGIDCVLNGVDTADLSKEFEEKGFDSIMLGWALGTPPEDPKQLWYSSGATQQGSSNAIGFANKEIDSIIDELEYEADPKKRVELYHRFDAIIHEEAPYTFLYVPKTVMLYRDYVKNVFIPADRQDLIPGADIAAPDSSIFYLEQEKSIKEEGS